MVIQKSCVFRS